MPFLEVEEAERLLDELDLPNLSPERRAACIEMAGLHPGLLIAVAQFIGRLPENWVGDLLRTVSREPQPRAECLKIWGQLTNDEQGALVTLTLDQDEGLPQHLHELLVRLGLTYEEKGDIFSRICHEQLLGLDMKDSIRKVARNVSNAELKLFATAVAIQLQSGGNLADLMDSLASVIRVRMRLNRRVRVLTSQTQFSKRVLIALPLVLFLLLNFVSPQYMETFYTTTSGKYMLVIMTSMVLFGSWVMNRLAVLKF